MCPEYVDMRNDCWVFRRHRTRRNRGGAPPTDVLAPAASGQDVMLARTIARHFPSSDVVGRVARLGLEGVEVDCEVASVSDMGELRSASLFFRISGGPFGREPVFASISGYEKTTDGAIVNGGYAWASTFGPVLAASVTGTRLPADAGTDDVAITLDGRRFRMVVGGVDRAFLYPPGTYPPGTYPPGPGLTDDPAQHITEARERLAGQGWLTSQVLSSGLLPLLPERETTVISVFRSETPARGLAEVKVNGADWEPLCGDVPRAGPPDAGGDRAGGSPAMAVLLRELAVLTPLEPAPSLRRSAVRRTLDGLALRRSPRQTAGWPGWAAHEGRLGEVLTPDEVRRVQSGTGTLPPDYIHFLACVAGPGAGPGYGLVPPERRGDVIPLAHAGCGIAWVLRLDADAYGTVWVDARGADGAYAQVAASFTAWYTTWLDASVRDLGPWIWWDVRRCATTGALSQVLTDLEHERPLTPGEPVNLAGTRIALVNGTGYLPAGSAGDPCHGCVNLTAQFDLPPDVFAPGVLSHRGQLSQ
ncbi:MAG: hypothetical protein QG622_2923 [Actinomycetota bacterium]|nr:hypothetical protein [Actinomycetota bacterium]